MSFVSANVSNEAVQKFLEILQNDFRTLANETKKKYPQIKEVRIFFSLCNALVSRHTLFSIYRFCNVLFCSFYLSHFRINVCRRRYRIGSHVKRQS